MRRFAKTLRPVREESVDFDTTQKNLFIEGDKLEAYKLLQEAYLGKVKIDLTFDPPYNTGTIFVLLTMIFLKSHGQFLERSTRTDEAGKQAVTNTTAMGVSSDWLS